MAEKKTRQKPYPGNRKTWILASAVIVLVGITLLFADKKSGIQFLNKDNASVVAEPTKTEEELEAEGHDGYEEPVSMVFKIIEIEKDGTFKPQTITVKPDTTIVFFNEDDEKHTATADNAGSAEVGAFDTGELPKGKKVPAVSYGIPGTYTYHDKFNPHVKGTIIVKE